MTAEEKKVEETKVEGAPQELTEEQQKALEFIKTKYIENRPATIKHMISQFYTALNNDKPLTSHDKSVLALDIMNSGLILFEESLDMDDVSLNQRIAVYNDLKKLIDTIFTAQYLNPEATAKRIAALAERKESKIIKPEG